MSQGRIGDLATGAVGAAAGTAVDPREGLRRLRGMAGIPVLIGASLLVGYLLGRRTRG